MEITATAKNVRISPQKLRLVVDQIKDLPPQKAIEVLNLTPKRASSPLAKVIQSAIANATNNFGVSPSSLTLKSILVGKGPVLKRYQPVARGRAHPILKRTSHIKVVLEGEQKKTEAKEAKDSKEKEVKSTKDERLTTKAK